MAIDIGSAATDRPATWGYTSTTFVVDNPANASGIINTVEVWFNTDATGFRAGTFFLVSGTTYQCRDSETIGNVTSGSKKTFTGLSIDVVTGDYLGKYNTAGNIERDDTGFLGLRYATGEHIDPGDQASYSISSGDTMSLYGTGTEAAPQYVTPAPVAAASSVQAPSAKGSGSAPVTLSAVAAPSAVQAPTLSGTGAAPISPSPVPATSEVQAPSASGSGSAPIALTAVAAPSAVQAPAISGSGVASVALVPISASSAVQSPTLSGSGSAPILLSPVAAPSVVQAPAVAGTGTAVILLLPIAGISVVVAPLVSGSGFAVIILSPVAVVSSIQKPRVAQFPVAVARYPIIGGYHIIGIIGDG